MLDESIQELAARFLARIAAATSAEELEAVRVEAVGRKGALAEREVTSTTSSGPATRWPSSSVAARPPHSGRMRSPPSGWGTLLESSLIELGVEVT